LIIGYQTQMEQKSPPRIAVPFNRPFVTGAELGYIEEAIANGHLSGNGPFSRCCSEYLREAFGSASALLTNSGTAALEMAALLADVGPGDEVILPSFTFSSTATAFVLRGAVPVFVDVREDTLNLDESLVAAAITDRTRAVVAVHYAGVACAMDVLGEITAGAELMLIEDAAHGFGSTFRGAPLGSFGAMAALSFHETKNVISGEGGALLVNDPRLVERAEILHEKGTNRSAFFRGRTDKYTWVDLGSSFLASDLAAAFLWAQLEKAQWINAQRLTVWSKYNDLLADFEAWGLLRRPRMPAGLRHNAHLYYILLPTGQARDDTLHKLAESGVQAVFHYVPLHSSPAGRRFGRAVGELSVTEDVAARLLRLPLWVGMTEDDIECVVASVGRAIGACS
jgi:dTDP-4-amino-4,6-dideoxygalactose transaminase